MECCKKEMTILIDDDRGKIWHCASCGRVIFDKTRGDFVCTLEYRFCPVCDQFQYQVQRQQDGGWTCIACHVNFDITKDFPHLFR